MVPQSFVRLLKHWSSNKWGSIALAGMFFTACSDSALNGGGSTTVDWMHHGHSPSEQRFSPLTEINTDTVHRLGLAWWQDIHDARSLPGTPLAVGGVLYYSTDSAASVYAVEGDSGYVKWRYSHKMSTADRLRLTMGAHRGVAYSDGRIFFGSADGMLNALDAENGELIWSVSTFEDDRPRYISGAPRVFAGKVIIGHGGGDQGARGYVSTYDTETGKLLWRFYTVPGNPAEGFENRAMEMAADTWTGEWWRYGGGGAVWNAITYDPEFDRVYIGTSNGSPYDPAIRSPEGGDNLFLCSIVALAADSGEYVWHYQVNPREAWDYKATMDIVLADLEIDGEPRKVLMQAPTNGFFYVIDRSDGRLISAEKWGGKVTWADRIDLQTGRPVEAMDIRYEKGPVEIWPGHNGAHNFQAMSYNPMTGLAYIPHLEMGMVMNSVGEAFDSIEQTLPKYSYAANSGVTLAGYLSNSEHGGKGSLVAYDPVSQTEKWRDVTQSYWNGGTMTTAGNLVFYGTALGEFAAYHATTGEKLWAFDAGLGIVSSPISYAVAGTQYVSLLVGYGASAGGGLPGFRQGWKFGRQARRLLAFKLDGTGVLPPSPEPETTVVPIEVKGFAPEPGKVRPGMMLYHAACANCHGMMLQAESVAPDLRESQPAANFDTFAAIVSHGVVDKGMPEFSDLNDQQLEAIYHYVRGGNLTGSGAETGTGDAVEQCTMCDVGVDDDHS